MESISSRFVKLALRVMRYRKPFETRQLDMDKVRRSNVFVPKSWMHKGCRIEKKDLAGYGYWVLHPDDLSSDEVLVYFHGGGYVEGMVKEQWKTAAKLCRRTGKKMLIPDYPLSPEYSHKEVYPFLLDFYNHFLQKVKADKIYFWGDSAGGGLLISFAMHLRDKKLPLPKKLVALSPWMDISMSHPDMLQIAKKDPMLAIPGLKTAGEYYAAGRNPKDYLLSPLYGEPAGLPELHLFAGTQDILFPDEKQFALQAQGKGLPVHYYEYPGMVHCWMFLPIPEAKSTLVTITEILS